MRLLGRISIGKGDWKFAEENQDYKKCVGKNIKLHGTLYTPEICTALLFTQITFVEKADGRKGGDVFKKNLIENLISEVSKVSI